MAKTHTLVKIFIASPGDVTPEREVMESVVSEFNLTWGDKHRVRLEVVKWETHSYPAFGKDAQDVINHQMGDEYDIFLGIMWGRFGTATARAESGTEEEFQRAYDRLKKGDRVQIMFYFKDAGIPPSRLDSEQIAKVQNFKTKIAQEYGGLYYQFETTEDFQTKARIHVSKAVQDWLDANTDSIESKTVSETDAPKPEEYNPLEKLTVLDDRDADEGLIDLVDRGTDAMGAVVEIVNRMTDATNDLGGKFTQRTKEAEAIRGKNDRKAARRIASNAANDLETFVKRMSVEIPEYYKQNAIFADSFSKVSMLAEDYIGERINDVETARNSIKKYRIAIQGSSETLVQFRHTISNLPRMTTVFNQARRRAAAIMDDLLNQMRIAANQAEDIEKLLTRLTKSDGCEFP